MQALAGCADRNPSPGRAYARRQPEKMPLYQVFQRHLPAFERMWTDTESGGCLPKFVTGELQGFVRCGILAYGFAQMHCERCRKRHLVAFSCKGRGFCPSCMGRRMNEGAANLVDHFLPEHVPIEAVVAQSSARSICTPPAGLHPMTSKGGKCCAGTSCAPRWPTTVCTCWRMVTSAGAQRAFEFKRPWSDGTRSIGLAPEALISRMAAIRRTFGQEVVCPDCGSRLRLIALVKKEETIQALLKAMQLPTQATGPPVAAKPEPATTEPLELEWSGEGVGMGENGVRFTYAPPPSPMRE